MPLFIHYSDTGSVQDLNSDGQLYIQIGPMHSYEAPAHRHMQICRNIASVIDSSRNTTFRDYVLSDVAVEMTDFHDDHLPYCRPSFRLDVTAIPWPAGRAREQPRSLTVPSQAVTDSVSEVDARRLITALSVTEGVELLTNELDGLLSSLTDEHQRNFTQPAAHRFSFHIAFDTLDDILQKSGWKAPPPPLSDPSHQ